MHNTDSYIYTQQPTDSALVLAYDYIVTRNKNITDIIYLNVVTKLIVGTTENNNTYNFVEYIAYLDITTS